MEKQNYMIEDSRKMRFIQSEKNSERDEYKEDYLNLHE